MLYEYVSIGYAASNLLLALIVFFKAPRSIVVKFYVFLVTCLILFGATGLLVTVVASRTGIAILSSIGAFLFAVFPFFFLHFMIIMVRREELLHPPLTIVAIYFAGLFSYTFELLGLIPKPIIGGIGFSVNGSLFLVIWMSVTFSIGIALLFTFLRGFTDKGMRGNLIVTGFAILLLLLPGPFTESIFSAFYPGSNEPYILSSLISLVVALYFVFRHRIIVNTALDAMKSALTFMSDVLLRMDDNLNIQLVRGGSAATLGYDGGELAGKNLMEIADQKEVISSYRNRALNGKEDETVIDVDVLSKTGRRVPMNLSMTVVVEAGQVVGFVGVARDMTERRRSEMLQGVLYRLSEVTRAAENLTDLCKAIHDVTSELVPARNFYVVLRDGLTGSFVCPYYANEIYDLPEHQPGFHSFNEQVMLNGSPSALTVHGTLRLIDGGQSGANPMMPVDWVAVPLKTASGTIGVIGIQNFSTEARFGDSEKEFLSLLSGQIAAAIEHKQSEEKIREQAALLNRSQDAIILETIDGCVTFWNEGAARVFGWSFEETLGRKLEEILKDGAHQEILKIAGLVREHGEWSGETKAQSRSGAEIILDCRCKLLANSLGKSKSIMMVCTNVTEKKKLEAQFIRAQRLESIGALAGGIAHDLNNVLSPIMMSIRTLKQGLGDDQSLKILQAMESSAKRGSDMIRQILMFGRGAGGERVVLQPRHILREVINIAGATFPKSIQFEQSISRSLWSVMGDATQIHQIILNLCLNARDAMAKGGTLTISAENETLVENCTQVNIDAKAGKYVVISVTDTGTGIPPGLLDKIFEPFFTTKEIGKGTGLGLSTAVALVKGNGGFINVSSEINRGSTFKVYLPATEKVEMVSTLESDKDQYIGHGELILVVDDESSIREIARATLEAYGYQVIVAGDGAEAIAAFVKDMSKVRAIIIDNMMPVMDGRAAIPALKRIRTDVKIIATSGLQEEITGPFFELADSFMSKPFTGEKLLSTVHDVISELDR
ncbi:MAG: PAS domain S-box protein [Bacteroidetes bacterium]|nr:PAS domain S-box protein [Bacteroidota bacterium]